jgi:putative oxidoreductase
MPDIVRPRGYGITLLRVVVGLIFIAHGYAKCCVMGHAGVTGFFGMLGIPAPSTMAYLITALELGGGIMLVVGLLTRVVALGFVADMIGAIVFAKKTLEIMAPKGMELELLLLAASVTLVIFGPGGLSIDESLRRRWKKQPATSPAPAS